MSDIKIPFGRTASGAMVSVDAVARGLECECFCAECDAPLVARKGEINQHHFAHYTETDCEAARETSLHKFAKQTVCEFSDDLALPRAWHDWNGTFAYELGEPCNAEQEPWLDGIRPDVLIQFDEPVAVEIRVAHPVPVEKIKKLVVRRLATLEIDLSAHRHAEHSEQEWRDIILVRANRFWLVQPRVIVEEMERQARRRIERAAFRDAMERRDAEHQQLLAAEQERRRQAVLETRRLIEQRERERKAEEAAAELQYQNYQRHLKQLEHDRYGAGLLICSDTEMHLREWQRRKAELAARQAATSNNNGVANGPELSGGQAQWPHDGLDAGAGRAPDPAVAGGPHGGGDRPAPGGGEDHPAGRDLQGLAVGPAQTVAGAAQADRGQGG